MYLLLFFEKTYGTLKLKYDNLKLYMRGCFLMNELTKWIAENPVVTTWVTMISLIGVLITIVALILQIKDKKRRAVYYTMSSTILVNNEVSQIDGIKILFKDKEIDTVAISNIKLWNGGNEILEESDFYPENELKIVVPETEKILATRIIEEADDTCKLKINISKERTNEAVISFYCLEPQQGATISLYHTNIKEKDTKLIGKIKGGKVLNKSVDVEIVDGEVCVSTGKYKIYVNGGIFGASVKRIHLFPGILGVSMVKAKRNKE